MKGLRFLKTILLLCVSVLFMSCFQDNNEITTISWWVFPNFGNDGSFENELINAFEKENPSIIVELKMLSFQDGFSTIETAIASNIGPDIVYDAPGRIIAWGDEGYLVPLNDIIEPIQESFAKGPLAASVGNDGNYYMYPIHSVGFMMAFNKNLLEDLDLLHMLPYERPDRAWTLDEYENLLRVLHEKLPVGKVPAVFYTKSTAGDQGTRAFMVNLHGNAPLMNESLTEYTFNNGNAVKNAEWLQKSVREGLILNGYLLQADDAIDMYCASNAASTILFSLQLEKINEAKLNYNGKPFESIYMPYPNNTGKTELEFIVGGPAIFNNGDLKKIEASKKFIEFMAQDDVYAPKLIEATGAFPVSSNIVVTSDTLEQAWNAAAVKYFGSYYNILPSFPKMRNYWIEAMQEVLNGADAQRTLSSYVEQSNAIIEE